MVMVLLRHAETDRNDVQKARAFRGDARGVHPVTRMEFQLITAGGELVLGQDLAVGAPVIIGEL